MEVLPYRNLYIGIADTLNEIFYNNKYPDKELERLFKRNKIWGSRDRGFVAEMVYDLIRWQKLVDFSSGGALAKRDWFRFMGAWILVNQKELPDLREFQGLNKDKIIAGYLQAQKIPKIKYSVGEDFNALGEEVYGDDWVNELEALNELPPLTIRVNTLRTTKEELLTVFKAQEFEPEEIEGHPDSILIKKRGNLFKTEEFKKGFFELQDPNSQKVARFCLPEPGMRIADMCAGGGGKALHLAALMENKGQIFAFDIFEWKLGELKKRAKRDGAHNIQPKVIESSKSYKRLIGSFDRVLLDAPCTGSGVVRRNPDAKYKIDKGFLGRVVEEQANILNDYAGLTRVNGYLVYVTCSIFPQENEQQIENFLKKHTNYELEESNTLLPSTSGFDGFYMARMKRIS